MILQYKVTIKVFYSLSSNNLKPHNKYKKVSFALKGLKGFQLKKYRYVTDNTDIVTMQVSFRFCVRECKKPVSANRETGLNWGIRAIIFMKKQAKPGIVLIETVLSGAHHISIKSIYPPKIQA